MFGVHCRAMPCLIWILFWGKCRYMEELYCIEINVVIVSFHFSSKDLLLDIASQYDELSQVKCLLINCHNLNDNATQPQSQHCSWVGYKYDCANPTPPPPHKLNSTSGCRSPEPQMNIYWPQLNRMWSVTTIMATTTTLTTTTTTK